jgi:hypothetical protein
MAASAAAKIHPRPFMTTPILVELLLFDLIVGLLLTLHWNLLFEHDLSENCYTLFRIML